MKKNTNLNQLKIINLIFIFVITSLHIVIMKFLSMLNDNNKY